MKRIYFVCMFLCLTTSFAVRLAQAQTETVLYNFTGGNGGIPTSGLTSDGKGNFYGTTFAGGNMVQSAGTVFELSPNGSGGWNETTLYNFCSAPNCADGAYPEYSYVIFDTLGNLYGTASQGGANGCGVVWELSSEGGVWKETVLYSFLGAEDGANPVNGLIMDPTGNLYGTAYNPYNHKSKVVFSLNPSGGGWTEQAIYDAGKGYAGLAIDTAGNIFGATLTTAFELSPNGEGGWNSTVIHTFPDAPTDGKNAEGTPVLDHAGNLYGSTMNGGIGPGTIYKLSPGQNGQWTEQILYSFKGGTRDGAKPFAGIVLDTAGNIFGTTTGGGKFNDGTVFELVPAGGGYSEKVLWSFSGTDGNGPYGSLILDSAGNLYGTTYTGGTSEGVVFEVTVPATWTTTAQSSSPNPSVSGQAVTFTAVVTSSLGAPPDGEAVTFKKGTTVLGTGTLSGGSASFMTSALKVGTTTVTAVYGGDLNFAASTSNAVSQVVNKATTTTTLTSSPNPSNSGQSVTFTAAVTPQFSGTVKGSVTFYDGTTALKTVALSGGVAKFTTSTLTLGSHNITATYNGSTSFTGSSASLTQTVN